MALGIFGIVLALVIFLYGAYRQISTLYLAPIAGLIAAAFNGINLVTAFTEYHVEGVAGLLITLFPTIFLGAILGKVFGDCGAATSVARTLTDKFVMTVEGEKQVKRAVLILLIIVCAMAYGGIDGFVAVFAMFPIAMVMAEKIGIPRRFVPALLCLGCGANSAPGAPQINNIVTMAVLKTPSTAALIPGLICFVFIEAGVYFFCSRMIIKAMKKGETFDAGPVEYMRIEENKSYPNFWLSLAPLALVFVLFAGFQFDASVAIGAGILAVIVLMGHNLPSQAETGGFKKWFDGVIQSMNAGAANSTNAILTVTAASGFAAVVTATDAFGAMVGALQGINMDPLILGTLILFVVVAVTSAPPAALTVGLPIIGQAYIWPYLEAGQQALVNPDALARVAAIAVSTFETLPVNGLVILTSGLARVKIKDSYAPIFMQTVLMTTLGTILCIVLVKLFPGLV